MQGSPHFCWIQALLGGHSALITHSGLQLGGGPIYPGKQEQASCPFKTWHTALAPHGEGWQGIGGRWVTGRSIMNKWD